jgi:uncharacterized protein (TIGR04255 family)
LTLIRPKAGRAVFERSPLTLVICQLQFAPVLGINDPSFVAAFQEDIRTEYPHLGRVGGIDLVVGPGGVEAKEAEPGGWQFTSGDRAWSLVLSSNALTIRAESYTRYEDLRERFISSLERAIERFRLSGRTRLGLRYVNQLVFEDVDGVSGWRESVRPELLGLVSSPELAADEVVMHSLGQTRFAEDESQLLARYGYVPTAVVLGDTSGEAAPRPHFLLDFDHFDARSFDDIDPAAIGDQLDYFHGEINKLFHWCITEEGARRLGMAANERAEAR